jgi:hypothetical protein
MTKEEILKGNKLIAVFMGAVILKEGVGSGKRTVSYPTVTYGLCVHRDDELEYHSSWNWLMPVVEKAWKFGKMVSLNFYTEDGGVVNAKIYNWELGAPYQEVEDRTPIKAVYKVIVDFIKWYNLQTLQPLTNEQ